MTKLGTHKLFLEVFTSQIMDTMTGPRRGRRHATHAHSYEDEDFIGRGMEEFRILVTT